MFFGSLTWGFFVVSSYKTYGRKFGYDDKFLILVVGTLSNFGNGAFRYPFGLLFDKFGF